MEKEKGLTLIELLLCLGTIVFLGGFWWIVIHFIIKLW